VFKPGGSIGFHVEIQAIFFLKVISGLACDLNGFAYRHQRVDEIDANLIEMRVSEKKLMMPWLER
jgi:hypothetical protein